MAGTADDNNADDFPHVLKVGTSQERSPRGVEGNHMHIWVPIAVMTGGGMGKTVGRDDAGGAYDVEGCVNCPIVRITRTK